MAKNYMPLGSKAKKAIAKKDKGLTAAAKAERENHLSFQRRLLQEFGKLRVSGCVGGHVEVAIHVCANDQGFVVRVDVGNRPEMAVQDVDGGSAWSNTLSGVVAALGKIPRPANILLILANPNVAAMLNPEELALRKRENWINGETGLPRANADLWREIEKLLQGHRHVAIADDEIKSPRMKECREKLSKKSKG